MQNMTKNLQNICRKICKIIFTKYVKYAEYDKIKNIMQKKHAKNMHNIIAKTMICNMSGSKKENIAVCNELDNKTVTVPVPCHENHQNGICGL